jgi:thiol-disulfide isomerase/thioredoxin
MDKKYKPLVWLGVIIVIAAILIVLGSNPQWFKSKDGTVLSDGMTIGKVYLSDKILVLHSPSCPHCLIVVPILREIEQETNKTFYYYDVSKQSDIQELAKLGLVPEAVPTVIIYGKVLVGERTKLEYETLIKAK